MIKQENIFAFLFFLLLTILFFGRFLSGQEVLAYKDLSRYFYPLKYLMVAQVKSGHFPLWNPYIFCGFPLLATLQVGCFYPLSLIFYLLPFKLAFNYFTILHYFLAASFMYLLLRHYALGFASALFGGIVFAFSGYLLSVSNMNTSLAAVTWLPLVVLWADRLFACFSWGNLLVLAVLLAVQFLGGEPTIIYVTLFFLAVYAAVVARSSRAYILSLGRLVLAGLIGLGLVAVQLFPFLELTRYSDRLVRTAFDLVTFRSFPPRELLTFVFPYFFGNLTRFGGYGETLLGQMNQDWLISPYLGLLPLLFVGLAFFKAKRKLSFFLLGVTLVSLLLAFGRYTPFYRLVFLLPGIAAIRFPVKYLFLTTFCLTLLASFGFSAMLEALNQKPEKLVVFLRWLWSVIIFLLLVFLAAYLLRWQLFTFLLGRYHQLPLFFVNLLGYLVEFNLSSLLFVLLYLIALALLLYLVLKGRLKKILFLALLFLLLIADLFANGYPIPIAAKAWVFDQTPTNFAILQKDPGLFRFFYTPELEAEGRSIYGHDYSQALFNTKDNFTANWHIPYGFYDFYGYESIKPWQFFKYYQTNFTKEKFAQNLKSLFFYNVKYIASIERLKFSSLKLLRHKKAYGQDLYLYENTKVLPRAYCLDAHGRPQLKGEKVIVKKYLPGEIEILATLDGPGHLFLSEAYYPGWRALVNGVEAKIEKGNNFFMALPLGQGTYSIKFIYDPLSFKLGGLISLATLLMILVGSVMKYRVGGVR